ELRQAARHPLDVRRHALVPAGGPVSALRVEALPRSRVADYEALHAAAEGALAQQSVAWSDVIAPLGPDEPLFLVARDDAGRAIAGLPLFRFSGPQGAILTSVPQAGPLGGVFTRHDLAADLRAAAHEALVAAAIARAETERCVALTVITNPFEEATDLYRR